MCTIKSSGVLGEEGRLRGGHIICPLSAETITISGASKPAGKRKNLPPAPAEGGAAAWTNQTQKKKEEAGEVNAGGEIKK